MANATVTVNSPLTGVITVEIEGIGKIDVNIEGDSVYLYVVVSHVYTKLTGIILHLSVFQNMTAILQYRENPKYLKVKLIGL